MLSVFTYIIISLLQVHPSLLTFTPLTFLSNYSSSPLIGYVSFYDTVSHNKCFTPISTTLQNSDSFISLSTPLSTSQVIDKLRLAGQQIFLHYILEESQLSKYLNTITEHSFSLSLSYMALSKETYTNTYNTSSTITFYSQEGRDKYKELDFFDYLVKCGDSVITAYDKGMLMIYSIKVIFNTSKDKEMFYKKNNFNSLEDNEINFNMILPKLKLMANIAGIFDLHIHIYAIQIGGEYVNDLIYNSMNNNNSDNDFLIRNCTLNNIELCMEVFPQLNEYFYNYTKFQIKKENYIYLEYFNHMKVLSNKEGLDIRNNIVLRKIKNIKLYANILKHIVETYPIHIEEIVDMHNTISIYKDSMFNINKDKLINCLRQHYEYQICMKEFMFIFEFEIFVDRVNDFLSKHRSEDVFEANFQQQSCLPKNMKWLHEGSIQLRMFNRKGYIYNTLGLQCYLKSLMNFSCNDGVVYMDCVVAEEEDFYDSYLICENKLTTKTIFYYTTFKYKSSENMFLSDLKEIES